MKREGGSGRTLCRTRLSSCGQRWATRIPITTRGTLTLPVQALQLHLAPRTFKATPGSVLHRQKTLKMLSGLCRK
jgi:hypothetical protein